MEWKILPKWYRSLLTIPNFSSTSKYVKYYSYTASQHNINTITLSWRILRNTIPLLLHKTTSTLLHLFGQLFGKRSTLDNPVIWIILGFRMNYSCYIWWTRFLASGSTISPFLFVGLVSFVDCTCWSTTLNLSCSSSPANSAQLSFNQLRRIAFSTTGIILLVKCHK